MDTGMSQHETLVYGGFVFMIVIFLISRIGTRKPELPKRPEPLHTEQHHPEVSGQFDSASLQTARGMVSELDRHPDTTSRTLALAEMLHRQRQYEARSAERQAAELQKETDTFEKILSIADRISGRAPAYRPEPDRYPGRINDWHSRREIPENPEYYRTGQWRP
ncbi:MAG: hypothetical protein R2941_25200 [Desulfobacterales bacterium]